MYEDLHDILHETSRMITFLNVSSYFPFHNEKQKNIFLSHRLFQITNTLLKILNIGKCIMTDFKMTSFNLINQVNLQ